MREDLLGYLLSALEPHEMRRIDQRLKDDPLLREELAGVQRMLDKADRAAGPDDVVELPPNLVSQTLDLIDAERSGLSGSFSLAIDRAADCGAESAGRGSLFSPDATLLALRPEPALPDHARQSRADLLVSLLAAAAILAILVPAVARYRGEARKVACQNNLRQLGVAISDYVLSRNDARLPQVAESGHEAFSGIWELRLTDRGLMDDSSLRWCADGEVPDEFCPRSCEEAPWAGGAFADAQLAVFGDSETKTRPIRGGTKFTRVSSRDLINSEHLIDAAYRGDFELLKFIQRIAGGHYAYNLGVMENGRYQTPRYEGRSTFAVLGDMPIAARQSANGIDITTLKWHHGHGANILYEDGSVRHVRPGSMIDVHDHPYTNHHGAIAAGVNIDDASLAPSWFAPTPEAVQR